MLLVIIIVLVFIILGILSLWEIEELEVSDTIEKFGEKQIEEFENELKKKYGKVFYREYDYMYGENYQKYRKYYIKKIVISEVSFSSWFFAIGIVLLCFSLIILAIRVPFYDVKYEQAKMERSVLVERLERAKENNESVISGDVGSLESVYRDIINFNNDIISSRYWSDNIWVGWYVNPHLKDLELIEV